MLESVEQNKDVDESLMESPPPRFQYALRPLPAMNRSMPSVPLPVTLLVGAQLPPRSCVRE